MLDVPQTIQSTLKNIKHKCFNIFIGGEILSKMPGLLRDPSEDPPPTDKGGSLTSPEDLRAKASSEIGECVEVTTLFH